MTELNNTSPLLMELAAKIREANEAAALAGRAAAEKAIEAGWLLCKAKEVCPHGDWLPFLNRAGMHKRWAQRLMQIANSGIEASSVALLGGVKPSTEFISRWRMPTFDEALFIYDADHDAVAEQSVGRGIAYVWEDEQNRGYYHIGMICRTLAPTQTLLDDESDEECIATKSPMLPRVEVGGDRPVDTIIAFLTRPDSFTLPISDWSIEFVARRLPMQVLPPFFTEHTFREPITTGGAPEREPA